MKKLGFLLLFTANLAFAQKPVADLTSGTITFSHIEKIDPSRMKVITVGNGPGDEDRQLPTTINDERELIFAAGFAKFKSQGGRMIMRTVSAGSGGGGQSNIEGEREETHEIKLPFESGTFFDMNKKAKISLFINRPEGKPEEAFYYETPFLTPENFEIGKKTKKILGYTCKKATVKKKDETVTVWFTDEIDFTFSPIAEYTPPAGFVLEIESADESFKAEKLDVKTPVPTADLLIPGGAKKVSKEEFEKKRREAMDSFRPAGF